MKKYKYIAIGMFATLASFANGQVVINITGATAFREAAHNSIIALLGGEGVAQRARADINLNGSSSASNLRIYRGFIGQTEYIVRATYSGSTQGVLDLADQNQLPFLRTNTPMETTGTGTLTNPTQATNTVNAPARFAFSDVDKLLSARPNAPLGGGPVGVVPFMFLAGVGAPNGITNMSDQIHNTLWNLGTIPASMMSGNANHANRTIYATGRNNGSGTRASILSETRYNSFNTVTQFNAVASGVDGAGTLGAPTLFINATTGAVDQNAGHVSNSGVKSMLTRTPSSPSVIFVSYLTISDALVASGYNEATGNSSGGQGARALTYNGVRYSTANVNSGAYTLWGYQQLYVANNPTDGELAFDAALRQTIPGNMGTAGIPIPGLAVERTGGDGGTILPLGQ
jgi:ABC-type phosphate transport system substrate-binding protein